LTGGEPGDQGDRQPAFNKNKHKFDWTDRRGVVERITANKATAIVLWDGRKSQDYLPIRSIELEPAELGTEDLL
jgi:hypothetical protein